MDLQNRWLELTQRLKIDNQLAHRMHARLEKEYSESHRKYHNLQHLRELFSYVDEYEDLIEEKALVELAIWYHDVIYSVLPPAKNELKSARFSLKEIPEGVLSEAERERLFCWIESTKKHLIPEEHATLSGQLFMDFDMAIIAAPREKYKIYAQNIRDEYGIYPDLLYKSGRKKALESFLTSREIFLTDIFREKYEKKARENVAYELEQLS
ncbi:MAG: putative metal-dependent HD superfamily phosphohydrolase [Saprospiraceae bacterium]|jgi:predicted metal-dependent HD superfamily phosphohydrolase